MAVIHVIPVPGGWSVEQAWEHIRREHLIPEEIAPPEVDEEDPRGGGWAVVEVSDAGEFIRAIPAGGA